MIKKKYGTMHYPQTMRIVDENIVKANASSRNDFIEKAIHFYVGYLNSQENSGYVNEVITNTIESKLITLEENMNSILFKLSVEHNILSNILAANFDIDEETLQKLRSKSIKNVKETIGTLNLEDIFNEYKESEE